MTAQQMATPVGESTIETLDDAHAHVAAQALQASPAGPAPATVTGPVTGPVTGRVGLELEAHLVDLADPAIRPGWARVQTALASLPELPCGSSVTLEPGGQVELSTPPLADPVAAIGALARDRATLTRHLAEHGLGAAVLGADTARPPQRINPGARYVAMEQHFAALGHGRAGREMMTATAALQVNLDAGPSAGWADRLRLVDSLIPVLVAASAASPHLGGRRSGWQSARREAWHGLDPGRVAAFVVADDPAAGWADYALAAPVVLVRDPGQARPVLHRVTFADWIRGHRAIDRRPTRDDLDYHLTTLFPPFRPRGYLEIRAMDAAPDRWWPALVALAVTLIDDPVAADQAADLTAGLSEHRAATVGCADPHLRRVVLACLDLARRRAAPALGPALDDLTGLIESGRSISDVLRARIEAAGPLRVLEEEAHA